MYINLLLPTLISKVLHGIFFDILYTKFAIGVQIGVAIGVQIGL